MEGGGGLRVGCKLIVSLFDWNSCDSYSFCGMWLSWSILCMFFDIYNFLVEIPGMFFSLMGLVG